MRKAIGLGLLGIAGIVACGTADEGTAASMEHDPTNRPGDVGSEADPTNPSAPEATPDSPDAPAPVPEAPPGPLARDIAITDVAVYQGVKVPVMKGGDLVKAQQRTAQIVAKRPGLLRVYVAPEPSWTPRPVTAELRLSADGVYFPVVRETKLIGRASTEEDPKSTFNLELPAESLPAGVSFQVSLSTPDGDDPSTADPSKARYPDDGSAAELGAQRTGKVRVVVVPVRYDADGSGRTPDVGEAQRSLYEKTLMKLYPASSVEVTTHAPLAWGQEISANGNGYASVLRAITDLRQKDGVDKDVYYYGLLEPSSSWDAYCGRGCVTGLSTVVDRPETAAMRASVGVGFAGEVAAKTMAHELGHAHGRMHAPCGGPASPDPAFPHQGGGIGVWGYDIFAKTLISPSKGKDIMGYCPNEWVSDYTYDALWKRISAISTDKADGSSPNKSTGPKQPGQYRVATVDGEGNLAWDGDIEIRDARDLAGGALRKASFYTESGAQQIAREARFFAFDHLPGGFVFVPRDQTVEAARWSAVHIEGFAGPLAR